MNVKISQFRLDNFPEGDLITSSERPHQSREHPTPEKRVAGGESQATVGPEHWVDEYLAHYGDKRVRQRIQDEGWVDEFLAYNDGETP